MAWGAEQVLGGHGRQAVAPWAAMNVPAAHGAHTWALPRENVPARHKTGWVALALQAKPGGHGEGVMAPDRMN